MSAISEERLAAAAPAAPSNAQAASARHQGTVGPLRSQSYYQRLLLYAVLLVSTVAIGPLLIMTGVNFHQYRDAFHAESIRPVARLTTNTKTALESFFDARLSALKLVVREESREQLGDPQALRRLLRNLKEAFGGFIDLGLIDPSGRQLAYAGPYELEGETYADHDWFHEVRLRGVHISEVFMGHRKLPHFVIAVTHESESGETLTLRATIDTEAIDRQILSHGMLPAGDAFLVNRKGVLQTPSRFFGEVLDPCPLEIAPYAPQTEIRETRDRRGNPLIMGFAQVDRSPFTVVLLDRPGALQEGWLSLRRDLAVFLALSVLTILLVVVWGARFMVNRQRDADTRRAALFHKLEYTNKMAAIGRLAAGVAHEINNPLAIINEKAGLLHDHLTLAPEPPPPERLRPLVDSVINSVERCGTITHRLLGFAKHMEVRSEEIDLEILLREVLSFLEREAAYRSVEVAYDVAADLPTIHSDRGQLQQVFLNIVNNAISAVGDGGRVDIRLECHGAERVAVSVADDGPGISRENLARIFEPFFTTKKVTGTGLGLSITYGIVQKLGGKIRVSSEEGQGACFTVVLPVSREAA